MKAGNATEAQIDLRLRGGTVIMRRLISPLRTRVSWYAMASMCQLGANASLDETIGKLAREAVEVAAKDRADKSRIYVHDFGSLLSLPRDFASSVSERSVFSAGWGNSS